MWQDGTVHPTHDMANEIDSLAEIHDGDTLYAEEVEIELDGSNRRHGNAIGYAMEEENHMALSPERRMVAVRSGNQDPNQVGYEDSLAWGGFGDEMPIDQTTTDSLRPAVKSELSKFLLFGSITLGVLWLWNRR